MKGFTMLTLTDYLSLFPAATQAKQRMMALASAVLSQAVDLLSLVQSEFPEARSIETAVGSQLDALGALLNVPRPLPDTSDAAYRSLLTARISANHWNGTNETLPAALASAFPGAGVRMIDNQDGTVTVSGAEGLPFPISEMFPCPAGIRIVPA